jgi:hypothetical protein
MSLCYKGPVISRGPVRNLFLACLLTCAPGLLHAAIGDDLPALRAAYGSAKAVGNQMLFSHDGFSIAVYFDGARSGMEIFVLDGSVAKKTDFTQQDIDDILAKEGAGQAWNPVNTRSGEPTWLRADQKLLARFNPSEKILVVMENSR